MASQVITIRNMVCERCRYVVRQLLLEVGLQAQSIELGVVKLKSTPTDEQLTRLIVRLKKFGFEVVSDSRSKIIEKAKKLIIDFVRSDNSEHPKKLTKLLTDELPMSYGHLTTLFHELVGVTIERFVILQRVELIKELLQYGELSLAEIADTTGYSSQQYLSTQFKSVTGVTPNQFKHNVQTRNSLDHVGKP